MKLNKDLQNKTRKSLIFVSKFGFRGPFIMGKIPHKIFPLKCGFDIGYGIGRKYRPIWVSVSVSDLNQNSGFGRTLLTSVELLSFDFGVLKSKIFGHQHTPRKLEYSVNRPNAESTKIRQNFRKKNV